MRLRSGSMPQNVTVRKPEQKLLFPMMLMLGIVMVILLVPAVLAFQI